VPHAPIDRRGVLLVLGSGAAFGANAVFAKLSYEAGATVGTFLAVRFCIAASVFWVAFRPRFEPGQVRPGLLLGLAYCGQAGFYFTALSMQDASVTGVFQAVTPALVAVAAVLIGREPARPRTFGAIAAASAGMALVALGGGTVGKVVPLGLALALASATWYAAYLLVGDRIMRTIAPIPLSTLIATGGGVGFTVGSLVVGQLRFDFDPIGWLWLAGSGVISTVIAVAMVMAGLRRIGPSLTGILTTFETISTIAFAALIFGERLTVVQALGAGLILGAVIVVQLGPRRAPTVPA
jgi:drug/metabolite transporter (DMT)-like permease